MDLMKEGAIDDITSNVSEIVEEYVDKIFSITIDAIKRNAVSVVNYFDNQKKDLELIGLSQQEASDKVYDEIMSAGEKIVNQTILDIEPFFANIEAKLRNDILSDYRNELMEQVKEIATHYADSIYDICLINPNGQRKKINYFYIAVLIGISLAIVREYRKRKGLDMSEKLSGEDADQYYKDVSNKIRGAINTRGIIKHGDQWMSIYAYYTNELVYSLVGVVREGYGKAFDIVEEEPASGVLISAHMFPAPDHAPYQGKAYTNIEYDKINGDLPRKFMTNNCRHIVKPSLGKEFIEAKMNNGKYDYLAERASEKVPITMKSGERRMMTRYEAVQYAKRCEKLAHEYMQESELYEALSNIDNAGRCTRQSKSYRKLADEIMSIVNE